MAEKLHAEIGPKFVKQPKQKSRVIGAHKISHVEDKEPFLLRSLVVLQTGFVFFDKANKNIKFTDFDYNCIAVLKLNTYPFDICCSNRNKSEIYATEPETETIHCIKVDKLIRQINIVKSMQIEEECRGISCWKNGLAVTVMRTGFKGALGLLDYNGKIKRKTWQTEVYTDLFRAPWYVESIKAGTQVVVSDQGNHSVVCLDAKTFTIIFLYKSENLIGPRSLAVDSNDNIYVIGSSEACHNVVKLSAEGRLLGVMLSRKDRLNYPSGIAYNFKNESLILQPNREHPTVYEYNI